MRDRETAVVDTEDELHWLDDSSAVSYPPLAVSHWTFDGAISIDLATPGTGLGRMTRI